MERDFVEFCQNELTLEEEGYYCEQEEDSEWFYAEDYEKWKQDNPEGFDDDMQQQMMVNKYIHVCGQFMKSDQVGLLFPNLQCCSGIQI